MAEGKNPKKRLIAWLLLAAALMLAAVALGMARYGMGYWPYRKDLWIQGIWIVSLITCDYILNFVYDPPMVTKIIAAVIIAGLILLTFWKQGLAGQKYGKKSK